MMSVEDGKLRLDDPVRSFAWAEITAVIVSSAAEISERNTQREFIAPPEFVSRV
jgi:hypothetical protein